MSFVRCDRGRTPTDHRRVFLLGDAAHLTPPFVGQGMGAGLRDAANLAWKLAGLLDGTLRESIVDSYQAEREPHARSLIRMAKLIGRAMTEAGRLCPNAVLTGGHRFDDLAAGRFAVVTSSPLSPARRATIEPTAPSRSQPAPAKHCTPGSATAIVRPDGTVLHAGRDLTKACAALFGVRQ